ncbi:Zn-dependent hydrolase [Rhodococcus sp. Leaf278]|uniref:N-acyl homoserine lactonase family protein n=1 Tax=Rhodococcus sp. Leaf278 TaxID=1736319 RepID=UPI00070C1E3C|nr:N-acyl homoserine lactonase family protein [Rhodococcus sp. Leaf278]KQU50515.1 Zn-dependent hydrolase [Rhodococcus sp. Leaf278]
MTVDDYSIWVLEYSHAPEYPVSGVLYGEHNEGTINLPYGYVVLKNSERTIMIDVGYNYSKYGKVMADRFGVVDWQSPRTVLAEIGVDPDDIKDVIVTHAHFDHFGNVDDFPNAVFHIQEEEFSKWLWTLTLPSQFAWLKRALNPDDVVRAASLAGDGRLKLLDGDVQDILPGIDVWTAFDSHTFGSQFVSVKNAAGADIWVLAGDLRYVFENITGIDNSGEYVPIGLASGSQLNLLLATEAMMSLVDHDHKKVIPIHEDRLPQVYPSRLSKHGLNITEITLAAGEVSRVR